MIGRFDEAVQAIKHISDLNGTDMEEKYIEELLKPLTTKLDSNEKDESESQFLTILKHPRVLVRFIVLCLIEYVYKENIHFYK